jgi:hypothetical protein
MQRADLIFCPSTNSPINGPNATTPDNDRIALCIVGEDDTT